MLFRSLGVSGVRADECASYGPRADRDVPREGDRVSANALFRAIVAPSCGGVENAPEHEFRLVDGAGAVVPARRESWARWLVELVPETDLAPGAYEFQVRRPVSEEALGDWQTLVRVTATAERDDREPSFAGIRSGTAKAERGSVPISPCQAEDGDLLRTRLEFAAADDSPREHDELLYRLDRRHPGDEGWEEWRTFRPTPEGDTWFFSWSAWEREAWGVEWEYRIAVRDMAGHETIGAATVTVTAPPRPGATPEPVPEAAAAPPSDSGPVPPVVAPGDAEPAVVDVSVAAADTDAVSVVGPEAGPEPAAPAPRRGCAIAPQASGAGGFFGFFAVALAASAAGLGRFGARRRREGSA